MNTQQAYINGFVKRASEYGYSEEQALGILKEASTRYMREFREGTPAGKQIEDEMLTRMGKDNVDLIKNNPKGIHFLASQPPNVNPELSEALMKDFETRAAKEPKLYARYGEMPREELARMQAGSHIRDMYKSYLRGTRPWTNASFAMYGKHENMPRYLQGTGRQQQIKRLAERINRDVDAIPKNIIDDRIARSNISNYHDKVRRAKVLGTATKAETALPKGMLSKLRALLSKA